MKKNMASSAAFPPDHHLSPPSEQLCYVKCDFCDTVLAVSVPCSSLSTTVTVRCGHCTNLLSVNMNQPNLNGPLAPVRVDNLPKPPVAK